MIVADTVSGGWVVGIVILIILLLVGIGFLYAGYQDEYDGPIWYSIGGACIVLTSVIWVISSWPFKYDYHHWVDIRGKVQRTNSRFISADNGTSQRFVFVINGKPYGVDDTRASLAHVGSIVHLRCKKEHQIFQNYSDDGWACRWMNDSQIN